MKVLHLLAGSNIGGIETLCRDYTSYSIHENVMVILWDNGPLGEEMVRMGVKVICLYASKKNVFSVVHRVAVVCQNEKADAVIAHHASPMSHLCLLYLKKRNRHIRTFAYAHEDASDMIRESKRQGLWLRKMIIKTSLNHADQVVAISKFVKGSLIDCFGTPENKIAVVYNGVDLSRFNLPAKPSTDGTLRMIYVGRLIPGKGVQVILETLTCLRLRGKFHLRIVGDGPYRNELERFVQEHELTGNVEFLGNRRDVPELLSESDVFIHMPLCEEGFGIAIVEAMAAGLLCVCLAKGGIPEIISSGKDGILVESSAELKRVLNTIISKDENNKIKLIRQNAVDKAGDFSIKKYAAGLDQVINSKRQTQ